MQSSSPTVHRFSGSSPVASAVGARVVEGLDTLQRVLLAIILIEIPLQLDAYLGHSLEEARLGAISGFNVSVSTICLGLLYALWLPRFVIESNKTLISKPLFIYLAIVTLSFIWAHDRSRTAYEIFLLAQAFLLFFFVANTVRSRSDIGFVVGCLGVGLLLQGSFMVVTWLLKDDIIYSHLKFEFHTKTQRVAGSLGSPNVASSFLSIMIPPVLGLALTKVSRWTRILCLAAIGVGCIGLVLTMSRGGWLATAVAISVVCGVAFRKRWINPRLFGTMLIGAVVLAISFQSLLSARLLGDDGGSAAARIPLVNISRQMIADAPLGVGANNWSLAAQSYASTSEFIGEWFYTVHNKYLLVLSETGYLGLFAFVAFLISVVYTGWKATNRNDRSLSPLALGFTAAVIGQSIHMTSDIFNSRAQICFLLLIAAMIFVIDHVTRIRRTESPKTA